MTSVRLEGSLGHDSFLTFRTFLTFHTFFVSSRPEGRRPAVKGSIFILYGHDLLYPCRGDL